MISSLKSANSVTQEMPPLICAASRRQSHLAYVRTRMSRVSAAAGNPDHLSDSGRRLDPRAGLIEPAMQVGQRQRSAVARRPDSGSNAADRLPPPTSRSVPA